MSGDAGTLPLRNEEDIVASRQKIRVVSQSLAFSLVDQTRMVTAVSELSRNTVVHGHGGEMSWEVLELGVKRGLRVHFQDNGPGIADIKLAMTDGWTSRGSLGLGLPGSRRLVHEFEIESAPSCGTRVSITRWK